MPVPLTREIVAERLFSFQRDNFIYIGSFMRSVVLAEAVVRSSRTVGA